MSTRTEQISSTFIWRRIHSLMGLWLILYLIEHLIVNSQAALWIGDDGIGFIRLVNSLESLPYLQVIESIFIGVPFVLHGYWGVLRVFQARSNSIPSNGVSPSLHYGRNHAFTWQRLTSWILLVGVIAHVVQMRFVDFPKRIHVNHEERFLVRVTQDAGLASVADREQVDLLTDGHGYFPLKENEVVVMAKSPGKAMLFTIRDTFKSPLMCVLYTIFVLAASFHAFNGFWTSLITWGAMLSYRSQRTVIPICWVGVGLLAFLGLAAIWGSYWINLRS